jgi:alkylglycerol monooxygenase
MIAALSAAVLVAGLGAIVADRTGRWKLHYVLKPGTMAAVILIAVLRTPAFPPRYQFFIVAGLAASVAGDVFMMLRKKKFTEGLTCFLVAHGLYIAAFLSTMRPRIDPWTILPLFLYAVVMMQVLFPHLGKLKAPVGLYIVIITTMAGLGLDRFILMGGTPALYAGIAAVLFVVSDSVLAVDLFVRKIKGAQWVILITYFAAQWLFAMSV